MKNSVFKIRYVAILKTGTQIVNTKLKACDGANYS